MDITPEQFGVGGAVILGAMSILFKRAKSKARQESAGDKSPEYWEQEFERITEKAIRNALAMRNEDIRRIVREELERDRR